MKPSKKQLSELAAPDLFRDAANVSYDEQSGQIIRLTVTGEREYLPVSEPKVKESTNQISLEL